MFDLNLSSMDEPTIITPNQPNNQPTDASPPLTPTEPQEPLPIKEPPKSKRRINKSVIGLIAVILLLAGAVVYLLFFRQPAKTVVVKTSTTPATSQATTASVKGLQLDTTKNYGNKYANGILPVGDNKYV